MRREDPQQAVMFGYLSPEERVPPGYPLRVIRLIVDMVLDVLAGSRMRTHRIDTSRSPE